MARGRYHASFCHSRFMMRGRSFMMPITPVSGGVAPVKRASSCSASRPLNGAAIQLAMVEKK